MYTPLILSCWNSFDEFWQVVLQSLGLIHTHEIGVWPSGNHRRQSIPTPCKPTKGCGVGPTVPTVWTFPVTCPVSSILYRSDSLTPSLVQPGSRVRLIPPLEFVPDVPSGERLVTRLYPWPEIRASTSTRESVNPQVTKKKTQKSTVSGMSY